MTYTEAEHIAWVAGLPRKHMGAGFLFVDLDHRVLMLEPTYTDHWVVPGGIVEADESPLTAAIRETHEELGLDVPPGRLLAVDWSPRRPDGGDSLNWLFAGAAINEAEIVLQESELRSLAWCTPPDVERLTTPGQARRIALALTALEQGSTLYLENGYLPG